MQTRATFLVFSSHRQSNTDESEEPEQMEDVDRDKKASEMDWNEVE